MKHKYILLGLIIFFSSCEKKENNSKPLTSKSVVFPAIGNYDLCLLYTSDAADE